MSNSSRTRATQVGALAFIAVALMCAAFAAFLVNRMISAKGYTGDRVRPVVVARHALQAAQPDRVRWYTDPALARATAEGVPWLTQVRRIIDDLPPEVYVSFDIDGLDPSLCPNTGTPVPGGLSFREVSVLLTELAAHRRIVGFDLNEIGDAEWDGNVAARLLLKLCGHAVRSQER